MALTEKYKEQLRNASSNLIYAWISENNLKYFSKKYLEIIAQKRAYQLKFMVNISRQANVDGSVVSEYVEQCIYETYGLKPAEIVYKLAKGETVAGRNWKKGIYGIGATTASGSTQSTTDFGGGYTVDTQTGDILYQGKSKTKSKSCNTYQTEYTYDADGKATDKGRVYLEGKTYYDSASDTSYSSVLNDETGKYEIRAITKGDNRVASDGKALAADMCAFWENAQDFVTSLGSILKNILAFFGIKTITTKDISVNQVDDGFEPAAENDGISKATVGIIGGVALLALLAKDKNKKPKLNKKK